VKYLNSYIYKVATVINREFDIDTENSVDKREVLNTNEFGYLSLHFIAAISEKRSKFIEYKNFKKIQFEIQVRTILQHAWAEIEHDLGYKSKVELPENISRRFFRLAGSLELADEEFERLRSDISAYETTVDEEIKVSPKNLPINQSTIVASYENENILNELDRIVAVERGATLRVEIDPKYMARQADSIRTLGIKNIEQLHSEARKYSGVFALFARAWLNRSASSQRSSKRLNSLPASRGIGLFYLAYIIAANSTEDQISGWGKHIFGDTGKLMDEVRNAWKKVLDEKDT
jgi:putative GTP pyrophosphokinase